MMQMTNWSDLVVGGGPIGGAVGATDGAMRQMMRQMVGAAVGGAVGAMDGAMRQMMSLRQMVGAAVGAACVSSSWCLRGTLLTKPRGAGGKIRRAPHIVHDVRLVLPKREPQTTRWLLACTYLKVVSEEH